MNNDTIDRLVRFLDEERAAHRQTRDRLSQARSGEGSARHFRLVAERDRDAAENKIDEWLSYCETITRLIPKARRKEIPSLPKRHDREIPF